MSKKIILGGTFKKDDFIKNYYTLQDNGFYKCKELNDDEKSVLKKYFSNVGFSALNFTDSRSVYQFYDLSYLWQHIEIALKFGIKKLNLATEPINVSELYEELTEKEFNNELNKAPFNYDYRTLYFEKFGGENGYIFTKKQIIRQIKDFIKDED